MKRKTKKILCSDCLSEFDYKELNLVEFKKYEDDDRNHQTYLTFYCNKCIKKVKNNNKYIQKKAS